MWKIFAYDYLPFLLLFSLFGPLEIIFDPQNDRITDTYFIVICFIFPIFFFLVVLKAKIPWKSPQIFP